MKYYYILASLLAFLAMECVGVYWLSTGHLPPLLVRVDPTVLVWGSMGILVATVWAMGTMITSGIE